MPLKHNSYTKTGRTFDVVVDSKPTGQKVYKAGIGQVNILDHGDYKPYVWNAQTKICKFNNYEIRLTSTGVEIYEKDTKLLGFGAHPEIEQTVSEEKVFERKTATISGLSTSLIANEDSADRIEISYDVDTNDLKANITFEVGGAKQVVFGTKITPKVTGEKQRLTLEFDQESTLAKPVLANFPSRPKYNFKDKKSYWLWEKSEDTDHKVTLGTNKTEIHLKEKVYNTLTTEEIKPDTWGPTTIAAADDCMEYGGSYIDNDGGNIAAGVHDSNVVDAGLMWTVTNTDLPGATINTGTKINFTIDGTEGNGIDGVLTLADDRSPGSWGSGNLPSGLTKHPDTVDWDLNATGSQDSPELNSFIQQRIDGNDVAAAFASGDKIAIVWEDVASGTVYNFVYWAEGVGDLTIVYTPSSGGISIPVVMHHLTKNIGV